MAEVTDSSGSQPGYGIGALITIIVNATTPAGQPTLFLITLNLTILSIGFAVVLGAVAGVLPAWRAARSVWATWPRDAGLRRSITCSRYR